MLFVLGVEEEIELFVFPVWNLVVHGGFGTKFSMLRESEGLSRSLFVETLMFRGHLVILVFLRGADLILSFWDERAEIELVLGASKEFVICLLLRPFRTVIEFLGGPFGLLLLRVQLISPFAHSVQ